MQLRLIVAIAGFAAGVSTAAAQEGARIADSASRASPDSSAPSRVARARAAAIRLAAQSLVLARQAERRVFDADSTVARWSLRDDRASTLVRKVSPIAFWVPIVTVAAEPLIWVDETRDGNHLNARYARTATGALAVGFIASRTTKHFIHRARPCANASPGDVFVHPVVDSLPSCPIGSPVSSYSSFFSEHTMVLFAVASAATFRAERQSAPNTAMIATVTFTGATVFSLGRIYQQHHWLSDVLVGAAVGTASGFLAAQLGKAPAPTTRP